MDSGVSTQPVPAWDLGDIYDKVIALPGTIVDTGQGIIDDITSVTVSTANSISAKLDTVTTNILTSIQTTLDHAVEYVVEQVASLISQAYTEPMTEVVMDAIKPLIWMVGAAAILVVVIIGVALWRR